jgi:multidrug efflux pump subunit AcrB
MRHFMVALLLAAPAVAAPPIVIEIPAPGLDAAAVAETVATPLDQQLLGTPGVRRVRTLAAAGRCVVRLDLDREADRVAVRAEVTKRVALADPKLPEAIRKLGVRMRPDAEDAVIAVAVRSDGTPDVRTFAAAVERVRLRLTSVPHVITVVPVGSVEPGFRVYLDVDKLAARNLATADVLAALRPAVASGRPILVASALGDMVVATTAGQLIRLRDVARVNLDVQHVGAAGIVWPGGDASPATLLFLRPAPGAVSAISTVVAKIVDSPSVSLPRGMSLERLEFIIEDTAVVTIRVPDGTKPEQLHELAHRVAVPVARDANVRAVAWFSLEGEEAITLLVSSRDVDVAKLAPPDVKLRIGRMRWPLDDWPGEGATIVARVSGADTVAVMAATRELQEGLASVVGVADLMVEPGERPRMRYDVDRNKLGHFGLTAAAVNEVIELATTGVRVGSVTVETPRRRKVDDLLAARIPNAQGQQVLLGAVVAAREDLGPATIYREDGRPCRFVSCNVRGRDVADVRADVRTAARQLAKPGVTIAVE